jgi:integrase/recombinase XerC
LGQAELTRKNYGNDLKDFAQWAGMPSVDAAFSFLFLGDHETVALRVQGVALDYLTDLQTRPVWTSPQARDRGDAPDRHGLAPATIERRIVALRNVVALAVEARLCPREVKLPKTPTVKTLRNIQGISRRDFLQILDTLDHRIDTTQPGSQQNDLAIRDRAIFRLLHDIGFRRIEVHRIQIEDIVRGDKGMSVWIQRKGDNPKEKQLWPIASKPATAIDQWLALRENPTYGPLFTHRSGKPLTSLKAFNAIVARWGVRGDLDEHLHPHKLRHTIGTTAAKQTGGNVVAVQRLLGHSDPKTTMIYIDNEGDEIRALQELLGGMEDDE